MGASLPLHDGVLPRTAGSPPGMRRTARLVAAALAALVCAGTVGVSPGDSAVVVALARVELPEALENPAPLTTEVGEAIARSLREGGFVVVPPDEFETAWSRRLREAGGFFDIVSGRPDLAKRRALRASALGDLHASHGARVLLQPELVVLRARFAAGKATWDGAKETAAPTGSGEVPALSLALRVEDLQGRELASSRAGIQLLSKYSMWNSKYGPVPREKLLADEARLRDAVARALEPLIETLRAVPAAAEVVEPVEQAAAEEEGAPVDVEPPPEGAGVAALRRLRVPEEEIVVPPEARARYLEQLRARLEEAGWWVLPADAFEHTLREIVLARGGIYDPITGRGNADELAAALGEARRQVAERYGASAFVTPGIFVRAARIAGESATWDGTSEKVADIAVWKKLLTTTHGTTRALSFGVLVEDVDGTPRHVGWGGIRLALRVERNRFVQVPAQDLFADPVRDRRAVERSLEGWLAEARAPAGSERP